MSRIRFLQYVLLGLILGPLVFGTGLGAIKAIAQSVNSTGTSTSSSGAIKVTVNTPPNDVVSGPTNLTGTGTVVVSAQGSGSVGIIATGSGTGLTFGFQGSVDGTNYVTIPCVVPSTGAIVTSASANGTWTCQAAGYQNVRVNLTAISSGTETFTLNASAGSNQPPIGTQGTSTNLTAIAGTTIVNGGLAGSQSIGGTVATNVAISANPINLGVQAVSSENTAVTTARQVQLVGDLVGKLIVLPYANPENFVSGVITSAMTGTTSTSLIAAPASGLRNYITACTFSNSHATVGTDMILQDGSGGTTIWNIPAAAVYGGAHITFPTPLRQPTTATALFVANVTTGASTKAACSGYKGA